MKFLQLICRDFCHLNEAKENLLASRKRRKTSTVIDFRPDNSMKMRRNVVGNVSSDFLFGAKRLFISQTVSPSAFAGPTFELEDFLLVFVVG